MMSDHWKLLANILGTPGPAEPVAKEATKKKPEAENPRENSVAAKTLAAEAARISPANESSAKRDPLAEIVDRRPDPVVPGFQIPEPPAPVEKPAKRSAWDTLIGTLGIKTAPEAEIETPAEEKHPAIKPERERPSSGFRSPEPEVIARSDAIEETRPNARPRRGFGSGLVDDSEPDSWGSSAAPAELPPSRPARRTQASESEAPARSERLSPTERNERGERTERPERGDRTERPERTARAETPRREDRPVARSTEGRDEGSGERRPPRRSFADGLIDWDDVDDEASLFVEADSDDSLDLDSDLDEKSDAPRGETVERSRDDQDRPRRGRRGGSRNRGRDATERESQPAVAADDTIGWDAEVAGDGLEPDRSSSGRGREPRREPARRDAPLRDESSRSDSSRRGASRSDAVRGESSRGEASVRREAPRDGAESQERTVKSEGPIENSRRGRRGQRQQMSAPEAETRPRRVEPSRSPEVDFIDDDLLLDEDLGPSSADADIDGVTETKEGPGRPRRRRGRRGRGGTGRGRDEKATPTQDLVAKETEDQDLDDEPLFAAELDSELIDDVQLDDDHEDDEEAERIRRGRRRGRGRGETRPRSDAVAEGVAPSDPESPSAAPKHWNVPTWLDTINLLVDSNIERHRRSGPPRAPQSRGGRR